MTDFPSYVTEAFATLYNENVNSPEYCIAKGSLYDELTRDVRFGEVDAVSVSRMLHNGEVQDAEVFIEEVLEGETKING